MDLLNYSGNRDCTGIRRLLSDHVDNNLSARQAWDVEKHLAACRPCAAEARAMKAAVDLLRAAPVADTSDDFMARLHARLDTVDPAIVGNPSVWDGVRRWWGGIDLAPFTRRVPVVSLGLAAAAVAIIIVANRPADPPGQSSAPISSGDGVVASVASSANSPFTDPAADNLEFRSRSGSSSAPVPF